MADIFVVKTASQDLEGYVHPGVFNWLQKGQARIGWSYNDDLDLRRLAKSIEEGRWASLNKEQQDAWRCHGFLDRVKPGDFLLYPHQPEYGKFTIAKVNSEYDYVGQGESIYGDFRSMRQSEFVGTISWNDEIVPPIIKCKLSLRGRFWQLYDTAEFYQLLQTLPRGGQTEGRSLQKSVDVILDAILPVVPHTIQKQFPKQDLTKFCQKLFERMGYIVEYREGRSERGSDLVITVSTPFFDTGVKIGIQIKSFTGIVEAQTTRDTLAQLLSGWEYYALDYGVVLSTGEFDKGSIELIENHNNANPKRLVKLIDGKGIARLFIENFRGSGQWTWA